MFWFYICFLISFKSFNVLIFFFFAFYCMFGRRWVLSGPPWWQNILGATSNSSQVVLTAAQLDILCSRPSFFLFVNFFSWQSSAVSKDHVFLLLVEVLSTRTTPITVTVLDILKETCNLEIDILDRAVFKDSKISRDLISRPGRSRCTKVIPQQPVQPVWTFHQTHFLIWHMMIIFKENF